MSLLHVGATPGLNIYLYPTNTHRLKLLQEQHTVYLVDFGLACKYRDNLGFHCDSEPDERKAHEGTLEYTSRDAHTGQ